MAAAIKAKVRIVPDMRWMGSRDPCRVIRDGQPLRLQSLKTGTRWRDDTRARNKTESPSCHLPPGHNYSYDCPISLLSHPAGVVAPGRTRGSKVTPVKSTQVPKPRMKSLSSCELVKVIGGSVVKCRFRTPLTGGGWISRMQDRGRRTCEGVHVWYGIILG